MLIRVLNTVRYLKPVQVYGRVFRRRPRVTSPSQERTVHSWNDEGVPKLWLYNLHYFERPNGELIQKWIAENPTGEGNGWEPYPLSLRIPNWIKWRLAGNSLDLSVLASLVVQAEFLRQSVEYHLLG